MLIQLLAKSLNPAGLAKASPGFVFARGNEAERSGNLEA
jgi:hypothetical protein